MRAVFHGRFVPLGFAGRFRHLPECHEGPEKKAGYDCNRAHGPEAEGIRVDLLGVPVNTVMPVSRFTVAVHDRYDENVIRLT
jgi:hypothetical protein